MVDFDYAVSTLDNLVQKFDKRIENLNAVLDKANTALEGNDNPCDEKLAKKLDKRLQKICKVIDRNDKKQLDKQKDLLNSNHLDALEKELYANAKILNNDDTQFLETMQELCNEAIDDECVDKLNFIINYTQRMVDSTISMKNMYSEQKEFIVSLQDNQD